MDGDLIGQSISIELYNGTFMDTSVLSVPNEISSKGLVPLTTEKWEYKEQNRGTKQELAQTQEHTAEKSKSRNCNWATFISRVVAL